MGRRLGQTPLVVTRVERNFWRECISMNHMWAIKRPRSLPRRVPTDHPHEAQIGLAWDKSYIDEIIAGNKRDE